MKNLRPKHAHFVIFLSKSTPLWSFCLLLWSLTSWGQASYDDLLKKLQKHPQKDTIRVEMLVDACVSATFRSDTAILRMATEAYQLSTSLRYQLGTIRALNCLGNYYFNRALNDKAVSYYIRALQMAERSKDLRNVVIGKSNLANVFAHNKNHDKAIGLLQEANQLMVSMGDTLSQNRAAILTNLAFSLAETNRHTQAIDIYRQVLKICQEKNIGFGVALTLDNLGKEYLALQKYPLALTYFEQAKEKITAYRVDFIKGKNLFNIAKTYEALGKNRQSLAYLTQAKDLALAAQDNEGLKNIYLALQNNYAETNQHRLAYDYLKLYSQLSDSLFNVAKNRTILELSTQYETEKKESQIKTLGQQKTIAELESQSKTTLIYSILGGFIALVVIAYFLFNQYKTNRERERLNAELQETQERLRIEQRATDSELKALRAQMNPHFMFNALNSIQQQFMYGDRQQANEQMGHFTYLTRQILTVSGKKKINLATEVEILTSYLELEKMRFSEDFTYAINWDDTIDEDYHQLPPMLIQPFVENAVKHGLLHQKGPKRIRVHFGLDEAQENILCQVEDNGIGRAKAAEISQKQVQRHESFSSKASEERLQLLSKQPGNKSLMVYEDLHDLSGQVAGTRVTLTIALG
jgi:two-component system, LytTR family, sensor kinase